MRAEDNMRKGDYICHVLKIITELLGIFSNTRIFSYTNDARITLRKNPLGALRSASLIK